MTGWPVRSLAVLVAGTLFMQNLDGTIVATAAPSMARSFHVGSTQIGICVTAYLVTVAALIPVSAWVADRWGARKAFLAAIAVFTGASALCALSTSLLELSLMRVLQGAGGAMMAPIGRLVVLNSTDKRDIIRAIAYLTWPGLLAPVVAPAIGGLLTTYASWHWIFLINLPLGVIALTVAFRMMPTVVPTDPGRLDWVGFVGAAVALSTLIIVAAMLGAPRINWVDVAVLAIVSVVSGALVTVHLLQDLHPLVRLDALRVRTFRSAQAGGGLFRIGINAVPFLVPLLFQDQFGWTPAHAGAVLLFLFVGNLAVKPLTTPLLRTFGFRTVMIWTTAGAVLSVAACALLHGSTSVVVIAAVVLVSGVFRSIGYTCYNTIAFADIDQPTMNQANTLASTIQQLTQALGVALGVVALKAARPLVGVGREYQFAFVVLAVVIGFAAIGALRLPSSAGESIREGTRS
ncbi:MAG: family efflux transporter permease subunit [Aeromicrobium sp.]|nr:family efflux transporter permease subunit [Aeromicrobium sp.]